jgi:hypothetical protein
MERPSSSPTILKENIIRNRRRLRKAASAAAPTFYKATFSPPTFWQSSGDNPLQPFHNFPYRRRAINFTLHAQPSRVSTVQLKLFDGDIRF